MKNRFCLLLFPLLITASCSWFRTSPEVGLSLSKHFNNKLYKQFDTAAYSPVFKELLAKYSKDIKYQQLIGSWYLQHGNEPRLTARFFGNGELDTLAAYLERSIQHGLKPNIFHFSKLKQSLAQLRMNQFSSIEEVYPVVAELELNAAASLVSYQAAISLGILNPKTYLSRYFIPVVRPDSGLIFKSLEAESLAATLRNIQPSGVQYRALQKAFMDPAYAAIRNEIAVNLERMRWKLPETGTNFVMVNIPDFSLTWFNGADTITHMKVCVGGRREDGFEEKIRTWLKTGNLDDMPRNHETAQLVSRFNAIQVNPVWNIPSSIAQSEIYYLALKDPYYLSNSNIQVYHRERLIDPDTIQWKKYNRNNLPFRFKQGSGAGNALGKFKFIFDNRSNIYLHDTNNKGGFFLTNRAISHGCVRIERPLEFAEHLMGDKFGYDQLRMEVNLPPVDTLRLTQYKKMQAKRYDSLRPFILKPKWFGIKSETPLMINYYTTWVENGKVESRPDVYGQNQLLLKALKKYAAFK